MLEAIQKIADALREMHGGGHVSISIDSEGTCGFFPVWAEGGGDDLTVEELARTIELQTP